MTRCPLLPLTDRVVIKPDAPLAQRGRIVLVNPEPPTRGRVVAIGPDAAFVKPRDYVVFGKYNVTVVTVNDVAWTVVRESDILCRLA